MPKYIVTASVETYFTYHVEAENKIEAEMLVIDNRELKSDSEHDGDWSIKSVEAA